MSSLSLCMIVKNEERTLGRVLAAAKQFCDEMVVVDTGSTDRTIEIAQEYGARVEHFAWCDDFAAARNYSFSFATSDWIIWLDADDEVPPETITLLPKVKEWLSGTEVDIVFCPYEYAVGTDGTPALVQHRERIIRRTCGAKWAGRIHEVIDGRKYLNATLPELMINHRTAPENMDRRGGRNLRIMDQYMDETSTDTRELYLYGVELKADGQGEKAARAFQRYLEVWPANLQDLHEEPYLCCTQLSDTLLRLDRPEEALKAALRGVSMNPARAEAYWAAAHIFYVHQKYSEAFPLFMAAAVCKPPTHGGMVFHAFYSPNLTTVLEACKAKILEKETLTLAERNAKIVQSV